MASEDLEPQDLVSRNTAEIITEEEIEELCQQDSPVGYIGYAPTGTMHIGHFTTIRKIADFIDAGFDFKILVADIHAELDIEKSPRKLIDARTEYYTEAIKGMLEASGIDPEKVDFVRGSDFQNTKEYQKKYMQIMENVTVNRAQRSVNEVVRHNEGMKASALLYSAMQIADCTPEGLDIDFAYAGRDQRRIYMLGREVLPKIGDDKPSCVFAPLLAGLSGGKMSASDSSSKIGIHDSREEVKDKVRGAYCPEGEVEENGVLQYARYLIFPILDKKGEDFVVERPEEYGGDLTYSDYEEVEEDFLSEELHPQDLKEAVGNYIYEALVPIQSRMDEIGDTLESAYPEEFG